MPRVAWINPTAGISGDMLLAAMADLGADLSELRRRLETLGPLGDMDIGFSEVERAGVRALRTEVSFSDSTEHRGLADIESLIESSGLTQPQKVLSKEIFRNLARAEAKVHGVPLDQVQLHEVGAVDSILDICGFVVSKELLGIDKLVVAPAALGSGTASGSHGNLPVPAPAVLELLKGQEVYGGPARFELTTPTGAAIVSAAASFSKEMPAMTIEAVGYGAGNNDPVGFANVVQLVVGTAEEEEELSELQGHYEQVVELQTNLDDISGELGGYLISTLLSKGALDVFIGPTTAKKGRPGMLLVVLATPAEVARLTTEIFRLTGTLGIRSLAKRRYVADRKSFDIEVLGESVSVKVGPYRAKPEFDQLLKVAEKHGIPILRVSRLAQAEIERILGS